MAHIHLELGCWAATKKGLALEALPKKPEQKLLLGSLDFHFIGCVLNKRTIVGQISSWEVIANQKDIHL